MKKILKLIPIVMAIIAVFAVSTFSWLAAYSFIKFPTKFDGSMKTEYFAGGDGSKDNPYIITTPVHFYNLAWLQYLGYFNLGEYINNGRAQSFFKLDFSGANLDLQGLALPPIGTREYPFIGNFDGNGKTISNFTVSNSKTDLVKRPLAAVFQDDYLNTTRRRSSEIVDILGLFGVTGDFKSSLESIYNDKTVSVGNETKAVSVYKKVGESENLEPLPSGNVAENEFYYSGMDVHSFYIDKIKVHSVAENALIGLAAGYVGSTIENVGVYRSKVTVSGDNISGVTGVKKTSGADVSYDGVISNYSIVGDYDDEIVGWTKAPGGGNTSGDAATWGGSIDMRTLNRRLTYMAAKVVTKIPSGYNFQAVDSKWGISLFRGSKSEFYWNQGGTSYAVAYLNDGTVLPINVNNRQMGLDLPDEITNYNTGFHFNDYYKNNAFEIIGEKNTGYIVGGGNKSNGYIRTRVQPLASGTNENEKGIYKSLGITPQSTAVNYDDYKSQFEMLTITLNSDDTQTVYRISDDVNSSAAAANSYFTDITRKRYSELGFYGYKNARNNFDNAMSGAYMVHGFHFMNKISETGYEKLTYSNAKIYDDALDRLLIYDSYDLIKGGINFTLSEDGEIRTIVGAFYNQAQNSLFDLYKVERSNSGSINSVERVSSVYKRDSDGKVYYNLSGDTTGYTKVFSFEDLTKDCLMTGAAYYFEIPVSKGDYVIGANKDSSSGNNAYLMYLDIGANGSETSGGTTKEPYIMKSVDFVSMSSSDTGDTLTVPNNQTTFPNYADVGFRLGAAADVIYFRREDYGATVSITDDAIISTIVNYWRENAVIAITVTPSNLGVEDNKAKWEN